MAVYESKHPTKDGRKYFFRIKYKDMFGVKHDYSSSKFKRRKDAEYEEALYKIKIKNQNICSSSITIEIAYYELLERKKRKLKPQSITKIENHYKYLSCLQHKKINDIDLNTYNIFFTDLESKQVAADYKNKILSLLRQIIKYSKKYHNTSNYILEFIENFSEKDTIKKEMQFFTYEEYKKFDNVIGNFEFHVFFEILYFLGLRRGECQALTWKDIDFNKKEIYIRKTLTTKIKGQKYTISSPKTKSSIRILPLTKKLTDDLQIMKNNAIKYKNYSDNWFVFGNSFPFPESTITNKKNTYCKNANVKQIRIHDFRHSCASLLINRGASIALVSKYLGHSKISTTLNTYTHMYKSELENVTDLIK